jgi:hypothetical protein
MKLLMLILMVALLTACTVTLPPADDPTQNDPFDEAVPVIASGAASPPETLDERFIQADEAAYYQVLVPSTLDEGLLFLEARSDLTPVTLTVYDSSGEELYVSSSPDWFSSASLTDTRLEAQAIEVATRCLGPCVIVENTPSLLYARITATRGAEVSFYAFDLPYGDSTEPENNDCTGLTPAAIVPVPRTSYQGALETVGDADCFLVNEPVSRVRLETTPNNTGIPIQALVFDGLSNRLLDTLLVGPNDLDDFTFDLGTGALAVRIEALDERAGPSLTSQYTVTFE